MDIPSTVTPKPAPSVVLVGVATPELFAGIQRQDATLLGNLALCQCVEIRFDLFDEDQWPTLASRLRTLVPLVTLIGTIRLQKDGGNWPTAAAHARSLAWNFTSVDWIDLELDGADSETLHSQIAQIHQNGTKVLLSLHDFNRVPTLEFLLGQASIARGLGADGFKVAAMSHTLGDTAPLYDLSIAAARHFEWFAAFAMGETGKASRLFSLACGANVSYGALLKSVAPGMLSLQTMAKLLPKVRQCVNEADVEKLLRSEDI